MGNGCLWILSVFVSRLLGSVFCFKSPLGALPLELGFRPIFFLQSPIWAVDLLLFFSFSFHVLVLYVVVQANGFLAQFCFFLSFFHLLVYFLYMVMICFRVFSDGTSNSLFVIVFFCDWLVSGKSWGGVKPILQDFQPTFIITTVFWLRLSGCSIFEDLQRNLWKNDNKFSCRFVPFLFFFLSFCFFFLWRNPCWHVTEDTLVLAFMVFSM